jgi:hypothetical protein
MAYSPLAMTRDPWGPDLQVGKTGALSEPERAKLFTLFEASYRQANPAYLEKSLEKLRYVALAHQGSRPAGFALGETRVMDLPRLPDQLVSLGGICCVAPEFRRRGLLGKLEGLVLRAAEVPRRPRRLVCGRMAHPATMRALARNPTVVPRPGVRPTAWQREVGQAIGTAYGVPGFDSETFVCLGDGQPIGYPRIEFESQPDEWRVFRSVERDRGDALLAIAWVPDAPAGW